MLIPQGTWCVVKRHVRADPSDRGEIIRGDADWDSNHISEPYAYIPIGMVEDFIDSHGGIA